ncbi:hypothetical protein HNQ78_000181 [Phycisphaera mikurensis]|nr:hypothetical protein [Phycisphaera mikurensis]
MQRTGSARGFTVLPRFQLRRRSGRPLNASSLGGDERGPVFPVCPPSRTSADRRRFRPPVPAVRGAVVRCGLAAPRRPGVVAARFAAVGVAAPARRPSGRRPSPLYASPPNQALQRTGRVCGFTVLFLFQARRQFGRPLNTSSLGRTPSGLVLLRTRAVLPTRGPSRVSAPLPHGPRRLLLLRVRRGRLNPRPRGSSVAVAVAVQAPPRSRSGRRRLPRSPRAAQPGVAADRGCARVYSASPGSRPPLGSPGR